MKRTIDVASIRQFANMEFLAKQLVEGFITGLHQSPYHGFSVEFSEHRLYNSGESTRHIDWKVFARTGKAFIRLHQDETNLLCTLALDASDFAAARFEVPASARVLIDGVPLSAPALASSIVSLPGVHRTREQLSLDLSAGEERLRATASIDLRL